MRSAKFRYTRSVAQEATVSRSRANAAAFASASGGTAALHANIT